MTSFLNLQAPLAVFLITLGLAQLFSSYFGWRAASLTGPYGGWGYALGLLLLAMGGFSLRGVDWWGVLIWAVPASPLALAALLVAGSYIKPPRYPDQFFEANHPQHGGCQWLTIPDGQNLMPALLIKPLPPQASGAAVCLIHGLGDTKEGFKWRLARALLAEGLTVLSIDLPGHGQNRQQPLRYPDCLSSVPAAIGYLRQQPGVEQVGVLGISLGGAMALKSLASPSPAIEIEALVLGATPLWVNYNWRLVVREAWRALRAPSLSILAEMSLRQLRASWLAGSYRSRHTTTELFQLLDPLYSMSRFAQKCPVLLVYSRRDPVAPLDFGRKLQQTAPQAELLEIKRASHTTLILMPEVNRRIARWLKESLTGN